MSAEIVALRNTVSGVAFELSRDKAEKVLAHPVWGKVNEIVRTPKPEVLNPRPVEDSSKSEDVVVVEATAEKKVK